MCRLKGISPGAKTLSPLVRRVKPSRRYIQPQRAASPPWEHQADEGSAGCTRVLFPQTLLLQSSELPPQVRPIDTVQPLQTLPSQCEDHCGSPWYFMDVMPSLPALGTMHAAMALVLLSPETGPIQRCAHIESAVISPSLWHSPETTDL